jgi:hypothetical protein
MAIGPGKYDAACTAAGEATLADTVVLIVVNGIAGSGFSMQTVRPDAAKALPALLRHIADQIEADTAEVTR